MRRWFGRLSWHLDRWEREGGPRELEAVAPYVIGLLALAAILIKWAGKG